MNLKKSLGGLGIRNSHHQNLSLFAKLVWRILTKPSSLWATILKERYLKNLNFLFMKASQSATPFWKKIVKVKNIFLLKFCLNIKDSSKVEI